MWLGYLGLLKPDVAIFVSNPFMKRLTKYKTLLLRQIKDRRVSTTSYPRNQLFPCLPKHAVEVKLLGINLV